MIPSLAMTRIWQWVSGGLGVIASVLAIASAVGEPLKVVGDIEVHPTAWVLLATVFVSVCCALVVPPLFERWWAAPRRARVERFRELLLRIQEIRRDLYRSSGLVAPDEELRADIGLRMADARASLRHLGVGFSFRESDFPRFIDILERGALNEALRVFPFSERREEQQRDQERRRWGGDD